MKTTAIHYETLVLTKGYYILLAIRVEPHSHVTDIQQSMYILSILQLSLLYTL
jgi:hypothetical protein